MFSQQELGATCVSITVQALTGRGMRNVKMKRHAWILIASATVLGTMATSHAEPVAGAYFEWDAAQDLDGNNLWSSTTPNSYDWQFDAGNQTPVDVADARFDRLTKAYAFPGASDGSSGTWDGLGSAEKATFEFVLDTDSDNGLIFESGGTGDGITFYLGGGTLNGYIREGTPSTITYPLTPTDKGRFIHIVFVADNTADVLQLYADGELRDSAAWTGGDDWSGGNEAALGDWGNGSVANDNADPGDLVGKMALFRYYRNKAFSAEEVTQNYLSLSSEGIWSNLAVSDITATSAECGATLSTHLTEAVLVWDPADQGTSNTTAWFGSTTLGAQSAGPVTANATGLVVDTVYTWRFHGEYDTTNDWSQPGTFATALASAQTPVFTSAVAVSHSTIALGWQDNASTETDYVLQRAGSTGGPYTVIVTLPGDTVKYTDRGLTSSTEYFYRLAATNSDNGSVTDFAACQTHATTGFRPPIPQVDDSGSATVNGIQNSFTLAASFDAAGADKLVVTVSMERDRGDAGTRIASVTYNGSNMTEAIQFKNYGEGPAAIYYLDNPGPAGPIVATGAAQMNGCHGAWLALSGAAEGVGVTSGAPDTWARLTPLLNNSLVVAHNHVNGGSVPEAQPPLIPLLKSNGQYSEAAAGYQLVAVADTVTPTFSGGLTPVTVAAVFEPAVSTGQIVWADTGASNITATSGWAHATINTNLDELVLVWDRSDKGRSNITDWAYSRDLGPATGGVVTGEATNLLADTKYTWRFYGANSSPTNGWSAPSIFPTALTAAQTPVFTNALGSWNIITLAWQDHASNETGYVLWRAEDVAGPYVVVARLPAGTTSCIDGVSPLTRYYYRLAATNVLNGSVTAIEACQTNATSSARPRQVAFYESFESPVVSGYLQSSVPDTGWVGAIQGYRADYRGLYNEGDETVFRTPYGDQAYLLDYTNAGLTTEQNRIGVLVANVTYTISFNVGIRRGEGGTHTYRLELVAFDPGDDNAARTECRGGRPGTILAFASGSVGAGDMSKRDGFSFTPDDADPSVGKDIGIRLIKASGDVLYDHILLMDNSEPPPPPGLLIIVR